MELGAATGLNLLPPPIVRETPQEQPGDERAPSQAGSGPGPTRAPMDWAEEDGAVGGAPPPSVSEGNPFRRTAPFPLYRPAYPENIPLLDGGLPPRPSSEAPRGRGAVTVRGRGFAGLAAMPNRGHPELRPHPGGELSEGRGPGAGPQGAAAQQPAGRAPAASSGASPPSAGLRAASGRRPDLRARLDARRTETGRGAAATPTVPSGPSPRPSPAQ